MKIIGLTGGIASGKNYIADLFVKKGAKIFDADAENHKLLEFDFAVISQVKEKFPHSFVNGKIDRQKLREAVFSDKSQAKSKLETLEQIIHPAIRQNYQKFLAESKNSDAKLVVLNIPLLLENGGYKCDYVVAIIAGKEVQKERFLERAKSVIADKKETDLLETFEQILQKQLSDEERINRADFVIYNDGESSVEKQLEKFLELHRSIIN